MKQWASEYLWEEMSGSKFWACLSKPLVLFHQHVKFCASSVPSTPCNAILTHSQPRSLFCPPRSYTEVVTTILVPRETPTAQRKLQSLQVILWRGGIFQIMIMNFKRKSTELHRYSPFLRQKAQKGLTNLYCLFYVIISPLPYLATSFLGPGISPPFLSQSWGLFLPRLSSTGSSPSLTTTHIPVFVLVSQTPQCLDRLHIHSRFIALLLFKASEAGLHSAALACQDGEHCMETEKSSWASGKQGFATETQGRNACHMTYLVQSRNVSVYDVCLYLKSQRSH